MSKGALPSPKIQALQGLSVLQGNILLLMKPIFVRTTTLLVTISAIAECKYCLEEQNFNWRKNLIKKIIEINSFAFSKEFGFHLQRES